MNAGVLPYNMVAVVNHSVPYMENFWDNKF